jgi:hypothetical protein
LWGLQFVHFQVSLKIEMLKAKYSSIISPAVAPAERLLSGTTQTSNIPSEVKSSIPQSSQSMIDFSGKVSDAAKITETTSQLTKEIINDTGEAADIIGTGLTYTGIALAPLTGGASLVLTGVGAAISSGGNTAQAVVSFSEGNSAEGLEELATAATSYGTSKGTAQLLKASKANEAIKTTTDFTVQGTLLNTISTSWNEIFQRGVIDNKDDKKENR